MEQTILKATTVVRLKGENGESNIQIGKSEFVASVYSDDIWPILKGGSISDYILNMTIANAGCAVCDYYLLLERSTDSSGPKFIDHFLILKPDQTIPTEELKEN